jgi:hypothetical protein
VRGGRGGERARRGLAGRRERARERVRPRAGSRTALTAHARRCRRRLNAELLDELVVRLAEAEARRACPRRPLARPSPRAPQARGLPRGAPPRRRRHARRALELIGCLVRPDANPARAERRGRVALPAAAATPAAAVRARERHGRRARRRRRRVRDEREEAHRRAERRRGEVRRVRARAATSERFRDAERRAAAARAQDDLPPDEAVEANPLVVLLELDLDGERAAPVGLFRRRRDEREEEGARGVGGDDEARRARLTRAEERAAVERAPADAREWRRVPLNADTKVASQDAVRALQHGVVALRRVHGERAPGSARGRRARRAEERDAPRAAASRPHFQR